MTLWGGRFSQAPDKLAWTLNASLPIDRRLAQEDVECSQAWVKAITAAGVLSSQESSQMLTALTAINEEFSAGSFVFTETDEDIHTAVERRLSELIGPLAGKLHTGRSRNDQVATDFRAWMLKLVPVLDQQIQVLQKTLVTLAEKHSETLMPGYTHLQRAQPISLAHWLLSYFWPLQQDRERLADQMKRISVAPLGCGALAGTTLKINRAELADELGFSAPAPNSLDAVSDRDFAAEFLFSAALCGLHLSKLAESVVLFSTAEFGYFELSDAYSTGSSLMPQKKNPDVFELTRGKAGTLVGLLTGLMTTLKGLPSTYDKDLQEDKAPVFAAADTLLAILPVISGALSTMKVNSGRMLSAIDDAMMTTDLTDYLSAKGISFRQAHAVLGGVIRLAAEKKVTLKELPLADWQTLGPFEADLFAYFDPKHSVALRACTGGTAPEAVKEQIKEAWSHLAISTN
jgi:argininosuccinate lyase